MKFFINLFFVINLFIFNLEAKWWIFGKSEDEVEIKHLYLNQLSFDEIDNKVTIYKDTLQDGFIYIKGKARIRKGKIGSVQISIDGKESWEKAKLSDDGSFVFSFRPEISKSYKIYVKAIDTRGKTNNIELTYKEVTVAEGNIQNVIKEVLDKMIEAYKNENLSLFMSYVSDDFYPDFSILERAIRNDFSFFDNIDLRYTINNITSDRKGKIFVSINFNRMVFSTKNGKAFSDKGTTEFVFKLTDKGPKVFSMKYPLIFGLSDASEVASGTVLLANNEPIIVVDESGNVDKGLLYEYEEEIVYEKNISLVSRGAEEHPGFSFATGEIKEGKGDFVLTNPTHYSVTLGNGVTAVDLGVVSLDSIDEVPESGYSDYSGSDFLDFLGLFLQEKHTYAFKLADGKYAIMEVKSVGRNDDWDIIIVFDYKYQPNGTRKFK